MAPPAPVASVMRICTNNNQGTGIILLDDWRLQLANAACSLSMGANVLLFGYN